MTALALVASVPASAAAGWTWDDGAKTNQIADPGDGAAPWYCWQDPLSWSHIRLYSYGQLVYDGLGHC